MPLALRCGFVYLVVVEGVYVRQKMSLVENDKVQNANGRTGYRVSGPDTIDFQFDVCET